MAHIQSAVDARDIPHIKTVKKNSRGWIARAFAALSNARMRQAEREVARYLRDTGGKFTDEAEREIERRFLSNQSRW
ncbi:MAG: hypothetical protein ABI830_10555 [Pseudolabrys sp.]